jgi:hypothetical protein
MLIMPINWGQADGGSQIETISGSFLSIMDSYSSEGVSSVWLAINAFGLSSLLLFVST